MRNNNDDFKYILQDTGHVYFGKELSYQEMMDMEEVPFKFKAIIGNYISKDVDLEESIINHIMNIDEASFSYKIFEQLKTEIKYFYKLETKSLFGKTKVKWVHDTCKIDKFKETKRAYYEGKPSNGELMIEEIAISKLALMMISI